MQIVPVKNQNGFSLLEILITVLVLGIGLLGLAALQNASIRNNQSAYDRTVAVILSDSMIEIMRANRTPALNGAFDKACLAAIPTSGIAGTEMALWTEKMTRILGDSACVDISCMSGICELKIQWDDSRGLEGEDSFNLITRFSI